MNWFDLLSMLLAAAMTAVVGNYLVQRWQIRSWYDQQRQLVHQQELVEIKELLDRIARSADARLHSMRTLAGALMTNSKDAVEVPLKEYQQEVGEWNRSLRAYYPVITIHYGFATTLQLENVVHAGFVDVGRVLDESVRLIMSGRRVPSATSVALDRALNRQAGSLSTFYYSLADGLRHRRQEVMHGKTYHYDRRGLEYFSTGDLIKALFSSDIDRLNVVRPA